MKPSKIIHILGLLSHVWARELPSDQLDHLANSLDVKKIELPAKSPANGVNIKLDMPVPNAPTLGPEAFNTAWDPASSIPRSLHSRAIWQPPPPASDQVWGDCVCRGSKLLRSMLGTAQDAGNLYSPSRATSQSPIQDIIQALKMWGWAAYNGVEVNSLYRGFDDFFGIGNALRALGYSDTTTDRGGKWVVKYLSHGYFEEDWEPDTTPYIVNGRSYRPTFGKFVYGVNPQEGALLAMNLLGPRQAAHRQSIPREECPEVFRHSDVLWGIWTMVAQSSGNLRNIKHHITIDIVNMDTQAVISRILQEIGQQLQPYPGVSFQTDTTYGQALLGTPNGAGFGYMLVEHKQELGQKYVHYMNIFSCSTYDRRPCMTMWVFNN